MVSLTVEVASGLLSKVDSEEFGEFTFLAVGCMSVSSCICEDCWLAGLVFVNAEDDCDEDSVCGLKGEVEDDCWF